MKDLQQPPMKLIRFQNGMVMAFDASGEQMAQCQGRYEDVRAGLLSLDLRECQFHTAIWGRSITLVSQDEFFNQ